MHHSTIKHVIDYVVTPALGDQAHEFDVEAIAREAYDYVVDTNPRGDRAGGFQQVGDADHFWSVVEKHRKQDETVTLTHAIQRRRANDPRWITVQHEESPSVVDAGDDPIRTAVEYGGRVLDRWLESEPEGSALRRREGEPRLRVAVLDADGKLLLYVT